MEYFCPSLMFVCKDLSLANLGKMQPMKNTLAYYYFNKDTNYCSILSTSLMFACVALNMANT